MPDPQNSGQSTAAPRGLRQAMVQHPLFFYFLIAYASSWILTIPFVLAEWGILNGDLRIAFMVKSFGPFLAAYIMTGVTEGKEGLRRLRRRIVQVRAGWQWYALILLGVPAVFLLGIAVLPGALASFQGTSPGFVVVYLVNFIIILIAGGPLGEEPGWRGYALPRMQPRYGPLWGTLLLGVLWVFWHLPDFLTSAQRGGPGMTVAGFLTNLSIFSVMVVSMAIIFSWVFNHTGGSVFMALLLHASINTFSVVLPLFSAPIVTDTDLPILIGVLVPALLILILTRGRLGFVPGQGPPLSPGETAA